MYVYLQAGIAEASIAREAQAAAAAAAAAAVAGTCDERDIQHHVTAHDPSPPQHSNIPHHQHQQMATAAFHISRPSHSISTIIAAPPPPSLHHTSVILDQDSFHVSRALMLQTDTFQVLFFIRFELYIYIYILLIKETPPSKLMSIKEEEEEKRSANSHEYMSRL